MKIDKLDKVLGFLKKVSAKHKTEECWIEMFHDGSMIIKSVDEYDDEDTLYVFSNLKELMEIIDNCND